MTTNPRRTAVLGLGPMGTALAHALVAAGVPTTVWNRSAARTEPLARAGAAVAATPVEAVGAADLVVLCLRDTAATREVVASVPAEAFAGRLVVTFASSTPAEARETAALAAERGIDWLTGAIMVPTPVIGTDDALILYSGGRDRFDAHRPVLEVMAPQADHVGTDHGAAALLDTAMLEVFFAGMTAFLHGAAMTTAQGIDAKAFLPYAAKMIEILPASMHGLADDVDRGVHEGVEDNLAMELSALHHIVRTSDDLGLDGRLPRLMHDLARRAVDDGHAADGWSRVIDALRSPA